MNSSHPTTQKKANRIMKNKAAKSIFPIQFKQNLKLNIIQSTNFNEKNKVRI